MKKLTILTAVFLILAGCTPQADTKEIDEVGKQNMELVKTMMQAYENEDIETLREVYSPDLVSDGPTIEEGIGLEKMLELNQQMFESVDSIMIKVTGMLPHTVEAEVDEDLAGDWVFFWAHMGWHHVESGKTVSMVFIILIGAVMFSRFIAWCNLSQVITDLITGLNLSAKGFMALILFFFFFLGFFIGALPLILVGVPIMYPVALSMGINPLWFAVLMVVNITAGASTPPVGVNLFTLKGVAPHIPIGTIYKGVFPFLLAIVLSLIIVFLFPSTATWLPSLMK